MSNVFCAIVAGDTEASMVYEDEVAVVFMDLNPVTPGHLLVVPRYLRSDWKTWTRSPALMCGPWVRWPAH